MFHWTHDYFATASTCLKDQGEYFDSILQIRDPSFEGGGHPKKIREVAPKIAVNIRALKPGSH